MTSDEIRKDPSAESTSEGKWLREIAYQLAVQNERANSELLELLKAAVKILYRFHPYGVPGHIAEWQNFLETDPTMKEIMAAIAKAGPNK